MYMYLSPATAIETNANFAALLLNTAVKNINAILNLHNLFMCWYSKVSTSLLLMWTDCAALHFSKLRMYTAMSLHDR